MEQAKRAMGFIKAAAEYAIGEDIGLTEVSILVKYQKLSVRIKDHAEFVTACMGYMKNNNLDFAPVNFMIRDETMGKAMVLTVNLQSALGFIVMQGGEDIMRVALGAHDRTTHFKVQQPCSTTVYKARRPDATGVVRVSNTFETSTVFLRIQRRPIWYLPLVKRAKLVFDDHDYVCRTDDGKITGKIFPKKRAMRNPTYIIKFDSDANDQHRAVMLSFALIQLLSQAYTELFELLRISMNSEDDE